MGAATFALGIDKQLLHATAAATVVAAAGKYLPDWITTYFLKPEQERHARWQKLRADAVARTISMVVPANRIDSMGRAGQ